VTDVFPRVEFDPVNLPESAWSTKRAVQVIAAFIAATTALMLSGAAGQLHVLFPAMAVAVGFFLYQKYPAVYVSFTLWLWFLSPFVRRVVDYRSYWVEANPILIAPALVTAISAISILRKVNTQWHSSILPYLLIASGTTMGLLVGVSTGNAKDAVGTYLLWMAPLCFGFYIRTFPLGIQRLKSSLLNTFIGFVVVGGSYALFQFVTAPPWDCHWLETVSLNSVSPSFGQPNPFEIRVWSTLNAPGPFSVVLLVGLVMLFVYKGWAKLPAAIVGYAAFLLCMVRTSWISWLAAILLIAYFNRSRVSRLILPVLVLSSVITCLTQYPPVAEKLHERFASTAAIGSDQSVLDREHLYRVLPEYLLTHPLGRGLSNSPIFEGLPLDSGLLNTPLQLGWFGTLLVTVGLAIQLSRCRLAGHSLTFERISQIAAFVLLLQIAGTQIFMGINATLLWTLLGAVRNGKPQ
jgi:hypothetical protein